MSTLDTNMWYRIFFTNWQTYTLIATDINASGTAGVALLPMGSSGDTGFDDWQPVAVTSSSDAESVFAFRSRSLGNESLLSIFSNDPGDTRARVDIGSSVTDFPPQSQWILAKFEQQDDTFYLSNAANTSDWLLSANLTTANNGIVYMQNAGSDLVTAGTWTFVSHSAVNPVSSTTNTTSSTSSQTATVAATSLPTPSPSSPAAAQTPPEHNDRGSLSTGAKAGIALGSVFAFLLLSLLGFWMWRRRKNARNSVNDKTKQLAIRTPQLAWNEMSAQNQVPYPRAELDSGTNVATKSVFTESRHELDTSDYYHRNKQTLARSIGTNPSST